MELFWQLVSLPTRSYKSHLAGQLSHLIAGKKIVSCRRCQRFFFLDFDFTVSTTVVLGFFFAVAFDTNRPVLALLATFLAMDPFYA